METKICTCCGKEKEKETSFLKGKTCVDGYTGQCRECYNIKKKEYFQRIKLDSEKWAKRKEYCRLQYYQLNTRQKRKDNREKIIASHKFAVINWEKRFPEKLSAKISVRAIQHMKENNKNEFHHWSYNKEHRKNVIELSVSEHKKLHRYIIYDQERMMYRRSDNNILLDTRESHENYLIEIRNKT